MSDRSDFYKLCALACSGDQNALQAVYSMMEQYLYSVLNRIRKQRSSDDDLIQEWRLALWRRPQSTVCKAAETCDDKRAMAFLGSIIHDDAIDLIRKEGRRRERAFAPELFDTAAPEATFIANDAQSKLAWLEEHLTDVEWLIVELKLKGKSHETIAASQELALRIPNATKGQISAVIRRIARKVEAFYESDK